MLDQAQTPCGREPVRLSIPHRDASAAVDGLSGLSVNPGSFGVGGGYSSSVNRPGTAICRKPPRKILACGFTRRRPREEVRPQWLRRLLGALVGALQGRDTQIHRRWVSPAIRRAACKML